MVAEAPAFRRDDWEPRPGSAVATRPEHAAEQLATLAAEAEPGTRLGTKDELRAYCGVSVGTFNEALRLVQARGVITVRPGRVGGLFASRQSPLVRLGNSVLGLDSGAASVADAVRIRDALDPLLVEDAVRHAAAPDLSAMRRELDRMRAAADDLDGIGFIHANWALHARIAEASPSAMLRSFYLSLLEIIESHTLSVQSVDERPLPEYIAGRYRLHADLVEAIAAGDHRRAAQLIAEHNTTSPEPQGPGEGVTSPEADSTQSGDAGHPSSPGDPGGSTSNRPGRATATAEAGLTASHPGRLIDVHAHFLTPRYVAAAQAAGHRHPDGMPGWPEWDPVRHIELMDQWGVSVALLSVSSPGVHFGDDAAARDLARHVNDAGAEVRRAHPRRFGQFASLPLPDVDAALTELEYALDELGCDGVTVKTSTAGSYLGDDRYKPLLAELDRRRTPVFVHPTSPPHGEALTAGRPRPMLEFPFDTTRTVADLALHGRLLDYPGIAWILSHGGGALPLLADRVEGFRAAFGDPVERGRDETIPSQLRRLWYDMAGTPFPSQVPAVSAAFGTGHLLYGSDYCWTPPPVVAAQVASLGAARQPEGTTWRELTTANALRLFPRLTADESEAAA